MPAVVRIDASRCINCSLCRRACPTETIKFFSTGHRTHVVEPEGCIGCDICVPLCPVDCISEDPDYMIDPLKLEAAKVSARSFARKKHARLQARKARAIEAARLSAAR